MSARDAAVAMDLALTLGSAARLAVDERVTERTFLDLARSLFRNAGGSPGREGRPTSRDGWTDLVEAYGGVAKLAGELEIDRRTLARWRSGASDIPRDKARLVVRLARSASVTCPGGMHDAATCAKWSKAAAKWFSARPGEWVDYPCDCGSHVVGHEAARKRMRKAGLRP